jgi:hypothetical protein
MDELDVRDLRGRTGRAGLSVLVGLAAALGILEALPETEYKLMSCFGPGPNLSWPYVFIAAACGIAIATYAVLHVIARRPKRSPLPVARVVGSHRILMRL